MPTRILRGAARSTARQVDRAFAKAALTPGRSIRSRSSAESLGHDERLEALQVIERFYAESELRLGTQGLFPRPEAIRPHVRKARRFGRGGEVLDLRWESPFEPLWSEQALLDTLANTPDSALALTILEQGRIDGERPLRSKYLAAEHNRFAHARWFRHAGAPRPCIVVLHGYLGGAYAVEERLWPLAAMFERGFDVVLSVLPFHGPRRNRARGLRPPAFPSSDPRFTIEGMRQMVIDHQGLFDHLRRSGAPSISVMGMSLGGYSSALLCTLEERLHAGVFTIPLAAIELFARRHGRMTGAPPEQQAQTEAMARAHRVVSPLARSPRVSGAVVLSGEADEVTGSQHSQLLARHFGAPLHTFEGGHILQFGMGRAFGPVWEVLSRAGQGEPAAEPQPL